MMEIKQRGKRLAGYVTDYVVFDLETTGLSPFADDIIELSALKVQGGKVTEKFSSLVNPGRPIPYGATAVNGITDDMVKDAPPIVRVLEDFLAFIGNAVLVGHNIHSFDMKFLNCAMQQLYQTDITNDYIDTLYMARRWVKGLSHYRLIDLAAYFHISTEGAHRALNDCIMNQKCFEEIGKRIRGADPQSVSGELCPRCGGELIKRNGRFGPFYGCCNYPRCRYTKNA